MKVAVHWTQQEGVGMWRVTPVDGAAAFLASEVELDAVITKRNETGERALTGGPRGWIEGELVRFEP